MNSKDVYSANTVLARFRNLDEIGHHTCLNAVGHHLTLIVELKMSARALNSPILFELFESDDERSSIEIPLNRTESETNDAYDNIFHGDKTPNFNSIINNSEKSQPCFSQAPPTEVTSKKVTHLFANQQSSPLLEFQPSATIAHKENNDYYVCDSQEDVATQPVFILGLESQLFPLEELTQSQFHSQLSNVPSLPALTQTGSTVKGLKRRYKQQLQPSRVKRKPVSFRCKLNGGWCLINQKNIEILDTLKDSLDEIRRKVNTSPSPNVRQLKLFLKEIETILKLLGDNHLEQTLPQELWDDMIHNSWNMFHETEKLLGSSPGNVALTLTNRNISEFTLNETQEFPSHINSADESQDCVRNHRQLTHEISNPNDVNKLAPITSENSNLRRKSISSKRFEDRRHPKKTSINNRAVDVTNQSTARKTDKIEKDPPSQDQSNYSASMGKNARASEVDRTIYSNIMEVARPSHEINASRKTNEIDKGYKHFGPFDCTSLLAELTQGTDFMNTQTENIIPSQIMNGTSEEPHIIYETQTREPSEDVVTEQTRCNEDDLFWTKYDLTSCKFSLKPLVYKGILSTGKDIKIELRGNSFTGTLLKNGQIQTDGRVFPSIGKWIQSVSNGRYFTHLPKSTRDNFHIEFDGKCLYELIDSQLLGKAPKKVLNGNKEIKDSRVSPNNEQQLVAENNRASKSLDELTNIQHSSLLTSQTAVHRKTSNSTQVNLTFNGQTVDDNTSQPLDELVRDEHPTDNEPLINQHSDFLTKKTPSHDQSQDDIVKSACSRQLLPESKARKENRTPMFHSSWQKLQASEETIFELVPIDEMKNLSKILLHPAAEWFKNCPCIEDFWETGHVPKCVLDDLNWD